MDKTNSSGKWTKPSTESVRNFVASSSGVRWCAMKYAEMVEVREALKQSKAIDNSLKEAKKSARREIKMVLFGVGESGKSTILNQLRIIRGNGFSSEDKEQFKPTVYINTIQSLVAIVSAMATLNIDFGNTERESDAKMVLDVSSRKEDTESISDDLLSAMKRLWTDNGVQECFARSNEYQLNDSAKYFLDDLERLGAKDYLPTVQDILRKKVKTTAMEEVRFQSKYTKNNCRLLVGAGNERLLRALPFSLSLIDAGDQRWEEQKRKLHCFADVHAILFCIAMSDYDQVTIGDDKTSNRLQESLKLFELISNSSMFVNRCPVVYLFLNKKDLFEEKLKTSPLTICFPEYTGNQTYEEASAYILTKFVDKFKTDDNVVHSSKTCATDTSCMQSVFDDIVDHAIEHWTCPLCAVV